ncbi:MAG: hypothetical protein AB7G44_07260 [Bacteroidia bacterium]
MQKQIKNSLVPRDTLAKFITLFTFLLLFVILIFYFISVCDTCPSDKLKDFQAFVGTLLPLLGTWMGAVITFYFTRENFKTTTESMNDMVKSITQEEKLEEVKVMDVMVKPATFAFMFVKDMDEFKGKTLKDLIQKMIELQTERLPVLSENTKTLLFLVYRTTLERFIAGVSSGTISITDKLTPDIGSLTMNDMFNSDFKLINHIVSIAEKGECFLPATATLAEARQLMLDNTFCQDVFITATGNKDEAIEGWVTNEIVIEKSELFKRAQTKR